MTPSNVSKFYLEPTHEEIALHAFLMWEKEGRQPGREMTYWLQAETEIRALRLKKAEAAAAKSAQPWPPPRPAARTTAAKPRTAVKTATKTAPSKTTRLTARLERDTTARRAPAAQTGSSRAGIAESGKSASRAARRA